MHQKVDFLYTEDLIVSTCVHIRSALSNATFTIAEEWQASVCCGLCTTSVHVDLNG